MTISEALYTLGVREDTLTDAEKAQLDRDGYLPLPGLLTQEQIENCRACLGRLLQEEGDRAGLEVHQEAGTNRLSDLINKADVFDVCFTHPRLLAGIAHVLGGDLKLSSLNFRDALPGQGNQELHADWGRLETPGEYQVCNSIWLLDDFSEENGATRVVPGSHRSGKMPSDEMEDPAAPHPDQVVLTAPAGTVVIFNSHTWHGGTLNQSGAPRRAMHSYFCRRRHAQQLPQKQYLRPETAARLSEAARVILDV